MITAGHKVLTLLGVDFLNLTMDQALDLLRDAIAKKEQRMVCFINADCLNQTFSNQEYFNILHHADHVFADGSGIKLGSKLCGDEVVDNVNGTDMLPLLCEQAARDNHKLFLLGAKPGVADQMKANMEARVPGLQVVGTQNGYFKRDDQEEQDIIHRINDSGADILLVAFGVPKQEAWLWKHKAQLQPSILVGVGGQFDFYSGNMPRAPKWMRDRGLEWAFRLYQEPRRMFNRYVIGNPVFLLRVLRWKRRNPNPRPEVAEVQV